MVTRKLLVAAIAATIAGFALPSVAADLYINIGPPESRYERVEQRAGYVWVPGAWQYKTQARMEQGRLVAERKGYRSRPTAGCHDDNKWSFPRGGWNRDRDGDGTPDRSDNHPNNPRAN